MTLSREYILVLKKRVAIELYLVRPAAARLLEKQIAREEAKLLEPENLNLLEETEQ